MKVIESVAQKEVTRKEFLKLSGLGLASLFGFGTIVKLFTGMTSERHLRQRLDGYSNGDYGGKKE